MKAAEVSIKGERAHVYLGNCVITWSKRRGCCKSNWWSLMSNNLTHYGKKEHSVNHKSSAGRFIQQFLLIKIVI